MNLASDHTTPDVHTPSSPTFLMWRYNDNPSGLGAFGERVEHDLQNFPVLGHEFLWRCAVLLGHGRRDPLFHVIREASLCVLC